MIYKYRKKSGKPKRGKTDLVKKLDRVFSLYIRLRDAMPGGLTKCISCGHIKPFSSMDAGHYISRTHMATRFSEYNVHSECSYCNRFRADHLIDYRENLIRKIGQNMYDILLWQGKQTKKWSDFELQQLIVYYTEQVKTLRKIKNIN